MAVSDLGMTMLRIWTLTRSNTSFSSCLYCTMCLRSRSRSLSLLSGTLPRVTPCWADEVSSRLQPHLVLFNMFTSNNLHLPSLLPNRNVREVKVRRYAEHTLDLLLLLRMIMDTSLSLVVAAAGEHTEAAAPAMKQVPTRHRDAHFLHCSRRCH